LTLLLDEVSRPMPSYYEGLPIYKAASDLAVLLDRVARAFPRFHKYTLGSKLREAAIELVVLISRCNQREQREKWLPVLCAKVEEVKILVNLGKELQAFQSFKQFVQVMERVVAVARQAEGWRRSLQPKERPEPVRSGAARIQP
jgi:hypothetical protein